MKIFTPPYLRIEKFWESGETVWANTYSKCNFDAQK
nr:MAG TPA: hypothetical protein [Caudoviricetes sp.]